MPTQGDTRSNSRPVGIGPTDVLSLRVSAAALVRVTFPHPETGQAILALERKATLDQSGPHGTISVTAKPFGGGVRLNQPAALQEHIPAFHFDSPRSRDEQDFRILIRPVDWEVVKQFCLNAFKAFSAPHSTRAEVLEADPVRELAEEFGDTLQVDLSPVQYRLKPLELLVENTPVETGSVRASHLPTVRVYTIFEALLVDDDLIRRLLANSAEVSDSDLAGRAAEDARQGGRGRANAALALPVDQLTRAYLDLPPVQRAAPFTFAGHTLEGNVPAVLHEVSVPKYERFSL